MRNDENLHLQTDRLLNKATRIITITVGILLAVSGFEHGLFETFQGSTPTNDLFIQAINKTMQRWAFGGEDAFTIIPNYLVTGLATIAVSIFIIMWLVLFVQRRHGPIVLLLLFVILSLVGGGIAVIPFFIITWAFATRINKPLLWWRRIFPRNALSAIGSVWLYILSAAIACWGIAIEIAILGYFPGQTNAEILLGIDLAFLLATFLLINISYASGFAYDIKQHSTGEAGIR